MMSTMSKDALARAIARGEYVVDAHAVAEAMLRRTGGRPSLRARSPAAPRPARPSASSRTSAAPGADVA